MVLDYLSDVLPFVMRQHIYTYSRPKKTIDYKMSIQYSPAFCILCCSENVVNTIEEQNALMHLTQNINPFAYDVISDLFSVYVGVLQTNNQQSLHVFILYNHDENHVQVEALVLAETSPEASNHWIVKEYYSIQYNGLCCMEIPNAHLHTRVIPSDGVKKLQKMNQYEIHKWNDCLKCLDLTVNQLFVKKINNITL